MGAICDAARAAGVKRIRLRTEWCAREAVLLYCSIGWWVEECERILTFVACRGLPRWQVETDGDLARFVVGDRKRELIRAERCGDRLDWREAPELGPRCRRSLRRRASLTFAIALALRGWPLNRVNGNDTHDGLSVGALGVQLGEAWYRANRWPVRTPEVPGLKRITLVLL